ncbi:SDR family oxidoreductase [Ramlibacter sp. AW1]|uniref:SDR family oxidoreductase n=1 Tax=Ramlibacter aurantiacus TaxID=2801330 RepID=A0A937D5L5_9BURK|nr:SDR family oxidoreductase [Ramlibacter aurantiacus]MBL0420038.1 SDR family oxidoreductase [Ramlibacter aurantiacus]
MSQLEGKIALVTGGASGIGLCFARRLARDGAMVVVADLRGAEEAAAGLRAEGFEAAGATGNVADEDDVRRMVQVAAGLGGLDIVVNNAAMFSSLQPGSFAEITAQQWQQVMAVNTLGPFLVAREAVPLMAARGGGSIVNVASNTVHKGAPGLLHYVSSKGAVIAFTRALARELGPKGITVNAIAPGFTLSDGVMGNPAYQSTFRAAAQDARALRRDQLPADLEGALAFLAGPDARFVTGQTLVVDGGNVFS